MRQSAKSINVARKTVVDRMASFERRIPQQGTELPFPVGVEGWLDTDIDLPAEEGKRSTGHKGTAPHNLRSSWEQLEDDQAKRSSRELIPTTGALHEKVSSPTFRRVKVLAREPSSGSLQKVLEVDVEKDDHNVPRVRISSPPTWLKHPTHTLGSMEGRLRRVVSAGVSNPSHPVGHESSVDHRHMGRDVQPGESRIGRETGRIKSRANILVDEIRNARSNTGRELLNPDHGASNASDLSKSHRRSKTPLRSSDVMVNSDPPSGAAGGLRYAWKTSQRRDLSAELQRSEADISPKANSEVQVEGVGTRTRDSSSQLDEAEDVGIQGLTIVLHLRGKDDLVISTDLTRGGSSL